MENGIQSDLIRGNVNTIILKALFDGDKYGYEICKEISERSAGQYELKQPTLYSCLKRLEKQGWITSYWSTGASNGGRRRYYTLTDLGRDMYLNSQKSWEYSRTLIDKLISDKPYDLSSAPPENLNLKIVPIPPSKRVLKDAQEEEFEEEPELDAEADEEAEAVLEAAANNSQTEEQVETEKTIEKESEPQAVQYNLFDKLKVDVDQNIREYETVSKLYEEANVRGEGSNEEEEPAPSFQSLKEETARTAGFDLHSGEVPRFERKRTEPETPSYTQAILSDSAERARSILFQPAEPLSLRTFDSDDEISEEEAIEAPSEAPLTPQPVQAQADEPLPDAPQDDPIEDYQPERIESKAEKEYKVILNKLLNTAKTHTAADSTPAPPPEAEQTVSAELETAAAVAPELYESGTSITSVNNRLTVETDDYSLIPHRQRNSLDFSELQAKMQTEGFKIRTHSKEAEAVQSGTVYSNKLMFYTLSLVFLLVAAELLSFYFAANHYLQVSATAYIVLGCLVGAMWLTALIIYASNPNKKTRDRFHFGFAIGLAGILAVLTFVASFAVACIVAAQSDLLRSVVLPTVLACNIPIGVLIYAGMHRSPKLNIQ